jgi:hypothetical protein
MTLLAGRPVVMFLGERSGSARLRARPRGGFTAA